VDLHTWKNKLRNKTQPNLKLIQFQSCKIIPLGTDRIDYLWILMVESGADLPLTLDGEGEHTLLKCFRIGRRILL
jgi:hypothetical protein